MDKSPLTYKRRRAGRPLSDVPWDASDVNVDPESAVSLLESEDEGIGDVTPGKENVSPEKRKRKSWSDETLPRSEKKSRRGFPCRRTRSSTALETDLNIKDNAPVLTGSILGKKDLDKWKIIEGSPTPRKPAKGPDRATTPRKPGKDIEEITPRKQGKNVEKITPRKHASKASPGGGQPVFLHSPIEFVKEKQAMFAEIDAFELESEEEDAEEGKGKEAKVEIDSPESSKGETSGQSPNTKPEQSTQETPKLSSTAEVDEKENG